MTLIIGARRAGNDLHEGAPELVVAEYSDSNSKKSVACRRSVAREQALDRLPTLGF